MTEIYPRIFYPGVFKVGNDNVNALLGVNQL